MTLIQLLSSPVDAFFRLGNTILVLYFDMFKI